MSNADDPDRETSSERESTILRAALTADVVGRASTRLRASDEIDEVDERTARVLVADDDPRTRDLVAQTLTGSGYDVVTAADGNDAAARVAEGGIDVVLLDTLMPRLSGVDACRMIRGIAGDDFVPVVFVFAKTDPKSRIEALGIGADAYVCKPLEQTELLVCVSAALRAKRAHDRMKAAERKLARLRRVDELTGAASFACLHERLIAEFARAERHAEPLACCVLDVDRLKVQNERGGRSLGDQVLRGVAEVIKGSVRDSDLVARYGGDEFFIVLPTTHFAGSLVVASRIWRDVAGTPFGPSGAGASVTASLGVALFPSRDVRTMEGLLGALEAALLEAKRRGGNRLCVFQQEGFIYTPSGEDNPRIGA